MPRFHKNLTNKGYDLSTITGHQAFLISHLFLRVPLTRTGCTSYTASLYFYPSIRGSVDP